MHNKDDAAPKDAEDEHPDWRKDLAGSVVSLIMATVLSMQKSTCPSGTRLENALDTLLQVYARDASGFLASVLNFQSLSEDTDESTSEEHSGSSGIESQLETQQIDTNSFSLNKMLTEQQMKLHNLFLNNEALKQQQEQDGICYDVGLTGEGSNGQQMNAEDEKPLNQQTGQTKSCSDKAMTHKEMQETPSCSGRNSINEQMITSTYFNKEFVNGDAQNLQTIFTVATCDKEPANPPVQEQGADAQSSNHQAELSASHFDTERIDQQPKVDVVELKTETDIVNTSLNKEWCTEQVDIDQERIHQHTTLNNSNLIKEMDNITDVSPNKGSLNLPIEDDPTNQQTISAGSDFDMESFNQLTEMDVADLETDTMNQEVDMAGFQLDQSTYQQANSDTGLANKKIVNDSNSDPKSLNQQTEMDVANLESETINQEMNMAGFQLDQSTNQQAGTDARLVNQQIVNSSDSNRKSAKQQTEVEVVDVRTKSSSQQTVVTDLYFGKRSVNRKLDVFTESISQHTSVTGLDFNKLSVNQQTDTMGLHFNIQPVDQQSNSDTESISQQTVINSLDFNQQMEVEVVDFKTKSINQQTDTTVESISQQTTLVDFGFDKKLVDQGTGIDIIDLEAKSITQQSKIMNLVFKKRSVSQQTDINTELLNQQAIAIGSDFQQKSVDQQIGIDLHVVNQQTELAGLHFDKKSISQQVEVDVDFGKTSKNQETDTGPYFYKESINQQTDNNVESAFQQTDGIGSYFDKESITDETEGKKCMNQQTDITGSSFNRQSIDQQTDNNIESVNQQTDIAGFYVDKKCISQQMGVDVYLVKKSISQQTDLPSSYFKKEAINDHTEIDVIVGSKSVNQQTDMTSSYFVKESINQQTDNNAESVNQQTDICSSYFSKELTDNQTEVDVNFGKKSVKQQVDMISSCCSKKSTNQQTDNNAESVNQETYMPSSYFRTELTDNQTEVNVNFGKKCVKQQVDLISSCGNKKSTNQQTDDNAESINQQTDISSSYFSKEWTDNQTEMDVNFGKKSINQQTDNNAQSVNQQTDATRFPGVSSVNQQTDLSGQFLFDVSHQDTDTSSLITQTDLDSTDTEPFNQQMDSTETAVQCSLLCGPNTTQLDISNNHITSFTNPNIPARRGISTTETNVDASRHATCISQATQVYVWLRERGINTKGENTKKKLNVFGKSPQLSDLSEYSDSISDLELDSLMETVKNVNTQITSACENLSALNCNSLNPMRSHCSTSDDTEEHSETESVDQTGGKLPENDQQRLLAFFHATLLKAIENQPDLAYFVPSSASYARIEQNQCGESELRNNEESEETASESGSAISKRAEEPDLINSDNTSIVVKKEDLIPFEGRESNLSVIDEQRTLPNSNSQETIIEQHSSTDCGSSCVLGNMIENEPVLISSSTSPKRNQPAESKSSDENKKLTKSSSNLAVINLSSESLLRCSTSRKLQEKVPKLENEAGNEQPSQEELVPWSICNTEAMPSCPAFSSALTDEAITRSRETPAASTSCSNQAKDQLQTNGRNKEHEFAFSPSSSEVDTSKNLYGLSSFGRRDINRPTTPIRKSRSIGGHELSRMAGSTYRKAQATISTCISPPSRRRDVADDFLQVRYRGNEFYTASENISTSSDNDFRESMCNNRRSRLAPSICNSQGDKDNNLLEQSTPPCGKEEEQTFPGQVIERPVPLENPANTSNTPQQQLRTNNCLRTTEEASEEPSKCTSEELRSSVSISRGYLKRDEMSRKSSDSAAHLKESRRRSSASLHKECKIYEEDLLPQSYIHSKHCDESRDSSKRSRSRRKKKKADSSKNSELQNNNSFQHIKELMEAKNSIIRCNKPTIEDMIPVRENSELSKAQSKFKSKESKHRSRRNKSNDLSEPIISVKMVAKEAKEAKKTLSSCNNLSSNDMKLLNKIERANREWRTQNPTVFPIRISKSSRRVGLQEVDPPKKVSKRSPTQSKTGEQQFVVQIRDCSHTRIKNQPESIITFHEKGKSNKKSKRRNSPSKNREKRNDFHSSSSIYYSDLKNGSPFQLTHSRSTLSPSTVQSGSTTTDIVRENMSSESIQSDGIEWDDYARAHNIVTLTPKLSRFYLDRNGRLQQSPQANNHNIDELSISSRRSDSSTNTMTYRRECSPVTTGRDTDSKQYTYTLLSQENAGPSRHMQKHRCSDSASRSPSSFHRKYSGLSIASSATTVGQSEGLFESMSSEKSEREFSDKTSVLWSTQRCSSPSEKESQFQDFKSNTLPLQSAFAKKNGDSKGKKKKKVTFQSGDTSPPRTTQVRVWTQQLSKTEEAIRGLRARIQGLSSILHF